MSDPTVQAMIRDSLDHCVKCTICETYCPVAAATPLFPGPKYVGPQAERYRSADGPSPDSSLDYCSSCGICTQVCPQGVKIAEINSQARALMKAERQGSVHGVRAVGRALEALGDREVAAYCDRIAAALPTDRVVR